ncbi:MAG: tetratricopeptide repeat protein [Bacteroidales bacterium]|nr:tetratricopeptide repeat protein [Bacteroidales bacterium]
MKRSIQLIPILLLLTTFISEAQTLEKDVIHAFGLYGSGNYGEAVTAFDQVINNYSKYDQKCIFYRGIAQYQLQNYTAAKSDLQLAVESGYPEACLWMAKLYVSEGSTPEAIHSIEQYLKESKHPDISEIKKEELFKKLHNTQEWFSLWEKDLLSDEMKIQEEVNFHISKMNFEKAHEIIGTNLNKGLDDAFLYELNSRVYFREEIFQLALNDINKAVSIEPVSERHLKLKAEYLIRLNKHHEAVEILTELLERNPGDFEIRFMRANTTCLAGDLDLAESDNRIYMRYFDTPDAVFLMGQILYEKGDYLDALKYFNRLINEEVAQAKYFKARGLTYYETKTYQYAAYDLSMSLDLDPNDAQTNLYLGITEYQLGEKELCCYYLKRAKDFGELNAITYLQRYCDETKRACLKR